MRINNFAPDWQAKACQTVDLYFASQNINLPMINIFCKAKNINQEADLINPKGLLNLLSLKGQACIIIYRMLRIR